MSKLWRIRHFVRPLRSFVLKGKIRSAKTIYINDDMVDVGIVYY
ncbi:Hypothetical protein ETEE_1331 [Edwardsiella anguillarum ET080813]|uniref:Uncharacterized protein n=1 Tax=Edwardsiella anguillarum ET080813 TaxID=667120 RepID=A0A076LGW2_9GAMM|nr:Hypothetical protein ETEE_1331 [Edwardsiella anguillarum ET080813]